MNTVVWIMMAATHAGFWVPGPEFSSYNRCRQAIIDIQVEVGAQAAFTDGLRAKCVEIKK